MDNVPDNPSTPSEQFVTLMDTHTRITVRSPKITGGISIVWFVIARYTVVELKFTNVTAIITAIRKSSSPFLYSPHGVFAQSSRNPVIMAAVIRTR